MYDKNDFLGGWLLPYSTSNEYGLIQILHILQIYLFPGKMHFILN